MTLLFVKGSTGGLCIPALASHDHACMHTYMCTCSHAHSCSHVPNSIAANPPCRVGTYAGHSGHIIQLLSLGDVLLSLGDDRKLMIWGANKYDAPTVVAIELHAAQGRRISYSSLTSTPHAPFMLPWMQHATCIQCSPHAAMTCTPRTACNASAVLLACVRATRQIMSMPCYTTSLPCMRIHAS